MRIGVQQGQAESAPLVAQPCAQMLTDMPISSFFLGKCNTTG